MSSPRSSTRSFLVVLLLIAAGCASAPPPSPEGFHGPMPLAAPFWSEPPRPAGLLLLSPPAGRVFSFCGESLVAETRSNPALAEFLASTSIDHDWIADEMTAYLAGRGYTVTRLDGSSVRGEIIVADPSLEQMALEFDEIANAAGGAELVAVIAPIAWGTCRDYDREFPARRSALVQIEAALVDITNRAYLWEGYASVTAPILLTWNEPPDHPKLMAALSKALGEAGRALLHDLESWDGTEAAFVWVGER